MRPVFIGPYFVPYEAHATIREIQVAVARRFGVSISDMMSADQAREHVLPRHVAMYLARRLTGKSTTQVADRFNRERTTVVYAERKIASKRKADPAFDADIRQMEGRL